MRTAVHVSDQERREQFQNVTLPDNVCCSDLNFSLRCYLDYTPTYYYNVYATVVVPFPFPFLTRIIFLIISVFASLRIRLGVSSWMQAFLSVILQKKLLCPRGS